MTSLSQHPRTLAPQAPAIDSSPPAPRPLGVLIVDEEIPFPLTTGKRIRSFNLIKPLAARHRITFLCHRHMDNSESETGLAQFRELGIEVEFLDRPLPKQTMLTSKPRLMAQLGKNLFSRYPFLVEKHLSRELRTKVAAISARDDIDLIHFEWTPYAASVSERIQKPWVVDAHNVESLIWRRYCDTESNFLKRQYIKYQWKKFHRFEKDVFRRAAKMMFVSQPDAAIARQDLDCRRGTVVDNGVDTEKFRFRSPQLVPEPRLLMLGSLDWRPNADALTYFIDEIWPAVRERWPDLQLDIVGRKPAQWIVDRVRELPRVHLYADVPSVEPYLQRAQALLVPLRIGGGSRLKILEAAASGVPVISTTVGAEGLALLADQEYLPADTPSEFVEKIGLLRQGPPKSLTEAARKRVEQRYDWAILAKKLESVWSQVV